MSSSLPSSAATSAHPNLRSPSTKREESPLSQTNLSFAPQQVVDGRPVRLSYQALVQSLVPRPTTTTELPNGMADTDHPAIPFLAATSQDKKLAIPINSDCVLVPTDGTNFKIFEIVNLATKIPMILGLYGHLAGDKPPVPVTLNIDDALSSMP
jgi:hypothetical protein